MKFDEAAARWVQRHFRGMDPNPLLGTVEFDIDWAAYDSGPRYCNFVVSWKEEHEVLGPVYRLPGGDRFVSMKKKIIEYSKELTVSDVDITGLIREITDLALSGEPHITPPSGISDPV